LIWFKNYLSGRRQFVFVNNELSDSGLVKAGEKLKIIAKGIQMVSEVLFNI
jgi:hypothetical protein